MIRFVRLADAEAIQDLSAHELGYAVSIDATKVYLEKLIKDPLHYFIVVFEDELTREVLGYAEGQDYQTVYSEPCINILGLAVKKKAQRKGVGRQLMLAVEQEAVKRGYTFVRSNSGDSRIVAHQFYEQCGYTSAKQQKRFIKKIETEASNADK